jgi:putative transposase
MKSDFSSRPVLIRKPDGTWRLTINYKQLNDVSVGDQFPLPSIESNLANLGKAKWFSVVDLLAGFHQIEMSEDSIHS